MDTGSQEEMVLFCSVFGRYDAADRIAEDEDLLRRALQPWLITQRSLDCVPDFAMTYLFEYHVDLPVHHVIIFHLY